MTLIRRSSISPPSRSSPGKVTDTEGLEQIGAPTSSVVEVVGSFIDASGVDNSGLLGFGDSEVSNGVEGSLGSDFGVES